MIAQRDPKDFNLSGSRMNAVTTMKQAMTPSLTMNLGIPVIGEKSKAASIIPPTTTLKLIKKQPMIVIASTIFP